MVAMGNKNRKQVISQDEANSRSDTKRKPVVLRLATFNTALFSMAPAVVRKDEDEHSQKSVAKGKSAIGSCSSSSSIQIPRSILKQKSSPGPPHVVRSSSVAYLQKKLMNDDVSGSSKSKLRVTINLPDNEISLSRLRHSKSDDVQDPSSSKGIVRRSHSMDNPTCRADLDCPGRHSTSSRGEYVVGSPSPRYYEISGHKKRNILEVLKEVDADLVALQEVKAEEEKGMRPLSDVAEALGMKYVFAESWAPQYGNAVLSKWPIKRWSVQKIVDDSDFRNVLKVVVDVPIVGELHFHCTQLDHLDEGWRMKQIMSIMSGDKDDTPHILIGGLNSLDTTDYSEERWKDIVKFHEDKGKPPPKGEVMNLLKAKGYIDAKHFAGDCESVVVIAKGQEVQGTCMYGTRIDYILASRTAPYKFVPRSYAVVSSKGTSDHHVVKVDIQLEEPIKYAHQRKKTVKVWQPATRGIWRLN